MGVVKSSGGSETLGPASLAFADFFSIHRDFTRLERAVNGAKSEEDVISQSLNENYHEMIRSKRVIVFRRSPRLKWPSPLFRNETRRDLPLADS